MIGEAGAFQLSHLVDAMDSRLEEVPSRQVPSHSAVAFRKDPGYPWNSMDILVRLTWRRVTNSIDPRCSMVEY